MSDSMPIDKQQVQQETKPTEKSNLTTHVISPQLLKALEYETPMSKFLKKATYMSQKNEPESLDFTLGDSHEMPLPGFVEALQRWSVPQKNGWYGYKGNSTVPKILDKIRTN